MSEEYCQGILRIALAQLCQSVGWNAAQSTPLELLTDVMGRYMLQLAKVTHRYAEQFGRTTPTLDDVGLAFRNMGISLSELEEYVRHVEPLPFAHEIVQFPAPKKSNLQIPKPGHKELLSREEHIEDYMPLLFPTPEDEVENEADQLQSQGEGPTAMQTDQGQTGVGGQGEVTDSLSVPGDKRMMTSPIEGSLPKKRPRLTNSALPEEAMHSQYEMKSVSITNTGDLTPTKGGKLPDARTPPQGFKKAGHDKPSVSKIFKKDKGDTRPATPVSRSEKTTDAGDFGKTETSRKEKSQTVEEIMIFPDGSSEKIPQQKDDEVSGSESLSKSFTAPTKPKNKISASGSSLQVPSKKKKVGRPRSRSKSPRAPKSPGQGKSPAQSGSSPRGRGRPPKDKSLLKTPEKKKETKNIPVLSTMEEMFASDVLDLSRKPPPASAPKESMEKKSSDADLPLDLSKGKESASKSNRGRGRPPLSPEKKRVREMNIDLCIEAVLKKTLEEGEQEQAKDKEEKAEKISELVESEQEDTNPAIEDSSDGPPSVSVKKEMIEDSGPLFDVPEQKKKKKEKTQKQKDDSKVEVRDKLKDKLKAKEPVNESIKVEPPDEVAGPPNVYDFPESPKAPVKQEVTLSPQKMFSVEFVDKDMESKEGEKGKEKSRDKERSKEHKEKKKEKKRDKEKKKKNKDKDKDRERKKDKEKNKEPGYIPNVSKLKIRIGSSPSSTTVNYMSEGSLKSPPNDSAQSSPRPELKLVIKALPPLSDRSSASPQSRGGSTPRDVEKERKKEKKREREKKREAKAASPYLPVKQESVDQPLFAPLPISRQPTPFSSSPSKSPTPPPPKKPSPQGLFAPFIKTPTPPPAKTPTPPPPKKEPTPPPSRKSPTPPPPKVPTPVPRAPTPETDFEPDSDHETVVRDEEEELQRFTPSPASTRKTFTPSPSNSPLRSPSPSAESVMSYARSKSNSQSPVRTPSPGRSPSPQHSPPPSPSPYRASVSPSNTKPSTPGHITSRSPSPSSPSPSPTPMTVKSEVIPPMPPPSMPGAASAKAGVQRTVIAETVTTFYDESGQKVWICPACKMPDDGSPMIGCDICDDWYHWPCVGVKEEPAEEESWYCSKCMGRSKNPAKRGRGRGRGRGPGRGKKKMM
eukprot:XP_011435349.1 PREDICTED: transcription initiation factor TFIID subunit 3-like isoform X1 [Crassostrea gigas]